MRRLNLLAMIVLAGCLGCGGPSASYDATVQGTVTVDGELAPRGRVMFHPVHQGPLAYGNIFPNGTYSLRIGQGDLDKVDGGQIPSGDYIVTVVVNMPSVKDESVGAGGPPTPGARLTAAKYADKTTSNLRATVKPGLNVVPLEVEGAPPQESEAPSTDNGAATDAATQDAAAPTAEEAKDSAADSAPTPPATQESTP